MHRTASLKRENEHGKQLWHRYSDSGARPKEDGAFLHQHLGFEITDEKPNLISLHGELINLFIERWAARGPVLEVTVDSVKDAKLRLVGNGCEIIKDEPGFPRCYVKDPFGLIYNLTS